MEQKQEITVIVILFNSQHLVDKIINNVNDIIKNLGEIILVENSMKELIISVPTKTNIIKIYPESNLGYGNAINLAVAKASFPLILILNPDLDILEFNIDNYSGKTFFLASGNNVDFPKGFEFPSLLNDTLRITLNRLYRIKLFKNHFDIRQINILSPKQDVDWFSGSLIFTNKQTLKKLEGFDESFFLFYEETDLCKRAKMNGIPIYIDCNIKYSHKILDSSSQSDVIELKQRSELHSFFHYHSKFDKTGNVLLSKFFIFVFAVIVYLFLLIPSLFFKGGVIEKRAKVFKTYVSFFLKA
jgi:GT2 family glycosyltransferase